MLPSFEETLVAPGSIKLISDKCCPSTDGPLRGWYST